MTIFFISKDLESRQGISTTTSPTVVPGKGKVIMEPPIISILIGEYCDPQFHEGGAPLGLVHGPCLVCESSLMSGAEVTERGLPFAQGTNVQLV